MCFATLNNINYFLKDGFLTVGDNSTEKADGITDASYSGEVVIEEKIRGKEVLGIAQCAFDGCLYITSVIIYAKLRSINKWAFRNCKNIEYINIPSSVTFIG